MTILVLFRPAATGLAARDLVSTLTFTPGLNQARIVTKSTSIATSFTPAMLNSAINLKTLTSTLNFSTSNASAKVLGKIVTSTLSFATVMNRANYSGKVLTSTISMTLAMLATSIRARTANSTISFATVFPAQYRKAVTLPLTLTFNVNFSTDAAADAVDPDEEVRIAYLNDVNRHYFKSHVLETNTPLAGAGTYSLELPTSSTFLEFIVGFVSTDQAGTIYVDRKKLSTDSWLQVKSIAVTSVKTVIEQVMTEYTRLRYVNGASPQTRFTFKAEIFTKI